MVVPHAAGGDIAVSNENNVRLVTLDCVARIQQRPIGTCPVSTVDDPASVREATVTSPLPAGECQAAIDFMNSAGCTVCCIG